jgi:hypothetical protein
VLTLFSAWTLTLPWLSLLLLPAGACCWPKA